MPAPPLLVLEHRTGVVPRVWRYLDTVLVPLGATFGTLETGAGVDLSSRNRVIQAAGSPYAALNAGVYKLQADLSTWSSASIDGGLPFADPSIGADAVVRSGLNVIYIAGEPHLVGLYRDTGGQLRAYRQNMVTGVWTESAASAGLLTVPTGAVGGLWNEIVFQDQLFVFGSDSATSLPRAFRYDPATDLYYSDNITIANTIDRAADFVVFNNRLHMVYRNAAAELRLGEWVNGTWVDLALIDPGPVNATTDSHRRLVFTDQTNIYAIVGSDSTWRCWQLDGAFTPTDISTTVLPASLRSAAVGGGSFVGAPAGRMIGIADVETIPGTFAFYIIYAVDGAPGTPVLQYAWQGNAAVMTTTGVLGGNVAHAFPSAKATGGERFFTPNELDVVCTGNSPVIGGERVKFRAWGAVGPADKTVEFYYNRQGEPSTALATLTGVASGGVALRMGDQVTQVQADNGATEYEVTWNIGANGIVAGDRVQLVPRIAG